MPHPLQESARARPASQSFRPPVSKKPRIVVGGEFRVNSGAWNTAAVGTATPGKDDQVPGIRAQRDRRSAFRRFPRPRTTVRARKRAHLRPIRRQLSPICAQCRARVSTSGSAPPGWSPHRSYLRPGPRPSGSLPHGDFRPQAWSRWPAECRGRPDHQIVGFRDARPGRCGRVITPSSRTAMSMRSRRSMS